MRAVVSRGLSGLIANGLDISSGHSDVLKGGCQLLCPESAVQKLVTGSLLSRTWES